MKTAEETPKYDNETCYYFIERKEHPIWYGMYAGWTDNAEAAFKLTDKKEVEDYLKTCFDKNDYFVTEHLFTSEPIQETQDKGVNVLEEYTQKSQPEITFRVWVVWDYEALPCQNNNNLNTRTND